MLSKDLIFQYNGYPLLIHAEISIYPLATKTTSASFYIAKAIESIKDIDIRYQINPMGTVLESGDIDTVNLAVKTMIDVVHNLGVSRVEAVIKIDSRRDKDVKLEEKMDSINRYLKMG